ncbi:hypothetical protein M422DRAFT_175844 [Sphaerobolus stellatus SS14]|uniref:Retrotransposon Copia-like N-terminal domain-containing protein n=1 Tax=Sphaerobolus stellatus (strain SS14) TaxID=990650 RepID=A0A0C9U7L2_SPHS4|nr:hypothetical protein M422DRAFT_175844 [Sphaerobolus stellatus SS14]
MSSTTSSNPPIFPDGEKLDGTNFPMWGPRVRIAVNIKGGGGYLDGSIIQPSPTPTANTPEDSPARIMLPPEPTTWPSKLPSTDEWTTRDAWVMGLIIFNSINPIGIGINMSGSAAKAWKLITDLYEVKSDLAIVNAQ